MDSQVSSSQDSSRSQDTSSSIGSLADFIVSDFEDDESDAEYVPSDNDFSSSDSEFSDSDFVSETESDDGETKPKRLKLD